MSDHNRQSVDTTRIRWWMLGLLAVAEMLGMSVWMTASSVSSQLGELWNLTGSGVGLLTTAVQIGFVIGTLALALSNLADVAPNRGLFAISALGAAACNAALLTGVGFESAVALRLLTGFCLAGVYPPALKMIATWFTNYRGLAIGTVVGALTIGNATPWLLKFLGDSDWNVVVIGTSFCGVAAALLIATLYRDGPHQFERRPFSWSLVGQVLAHRPTRLATCGYLGHMWELYAMWTWVPLFLAAAAERRGIVSAGLVDLAAFATIAAGGAGCVIGGWLADRIGRPRTVNLTMLVSGICCLVVGAVFGLPFWIVFLVTVVWGFFVVADSAQFSAMVTEVAPRHAVGTALSIQTSLGFLLTTVTIQLIPWVQSMVGWRWAFAVLGLGPALGIFAIEKFRRVNGRI